MNNLVRTALFAACLSALSTAPVLSQTIGDVEAGRMIASSLCVQCHRLTERDNDPDRMPPDFAAVANMPSFTELSMRVFLQTPHGPMPRYQFSQNELDDIIAYIASLKRR